MHRRTLGLLLLVTVVILVVAAGAASAHGAAPASPGDADPNGTWWTGAHMGPLGSMAYDGGSGGASACQGAWTGAMMGPAGGMMGGANGWGTGGGWGLWFLWPLLFLALAVGLGYLVLTRTNDRGEDRALAVLRERYARGELSDEEYVSRREALRASTG